MFVFIVLPWFQKFFRLANAICKSKEWKKKGTRSGLASKISMSLERLLLCAAFTRPWASSSWAWRSKSLKRLKSPGEKHTTVVVKKTTLMICALKKFLFSCFSGQFSIEWHRWHWIVYLALGMVEKTRAFILANQMHSSNHSRPSHWHFHALQRFYSSRLAIFTNALNTIVP